MSRDSKALWDGDSDGSAPSDSNAAPDVSQNALSGDATEPPELQRLFQLNSQLQPVSGGQQVVLEPSSSEEQFQMDDIAGNSDGIPRLPGRVRRLFAY